MTTPFTKVDLGGEEKDCGNLNKYLKKYFLFIK